jgi:Na+-transporting methylmalonyl-CoA/oxaloacetate decarboxylase gamma subunit
MDNLGWGLQMTVLGMGLVFTLLALLWGLLALALRFDPPPSVAVAPEVVLREAERIADLADDAIGQQVPVPATVNGMDAELVAAIMIAVLTHKTIRRQQAAPLMRSYWPGSLLYASRWVAVGRARQNRSWQRRG